VDLRTGTMRARRPDDFMTQATRVAPDFERSTQFFETFMLDVFGGDREMVDFMQRMLGYCLTGDRREQVLFFWHGSGANAKSTLLDLVQWLLDGYALKLPAAALMVTRNDRHPTELAQLRGRRLAIASELDEGQFWNEALIKELTGDEVLTARFMRGDFFEFQMQQKHVIVGNHKPRLRGGDPAIARRLVLVPFEQRFDGARRDKDMPAKLRAEAPAILAWIVVKRLVSEGLAGGNGVEEPHGLRDRCDGSHTLAPPILRSSACTAARSRSGTTSPRCTAMKVPSGSSWTATPAISARAMTVAVSACMSAAVLAECSVSVVLFSAFAGLPPGVRTCGAVKMRPLPSCAAVRPSAVLPVAPVSRSSRAPGGERRAGPCGQPRFIAGTRDKQLLADSHAGRGEAVAVAVA